MLFKIVWAVCEARFRFPSLGLKQLAALRARDSAPSAAFGTPSRRGARRGRLWGCAPFSAPLASPPKHPLRFSTTFAWRGRRVFAAGASLTRCARSGDLPPRRVNARVRFCFGQTSFQTTDIIAGSKDDFVPFQLLQDIWHHGLEENQIATQI